MAKNIISSISSRSPFIDTTTGTLTSHGLGVLSDIITRAGGTFGSIAQEHGGTGADNATAARVNLNVPAAGADINLQGQVTALSALTDVDSSRGKLGVPVAGVDVASNGQVTATHLAAPLPTVQGGTGINASSLADLLSQFGIKYQRVSLNPTAATAGATADTAFTWNTPYPDTNYTAVVVLESSAAIGASGNVAWYAKAAAGFTIRLTAITANAANGAAHVIGIHD